MFSLFEFIFFAFQFPGLSKVDFYSCWLGLSFQTRGVILVIPVGHGCGPSLCWPGLLCQCLGMVWGCGQELLPRNLHGSLDESLNANCDMPKQALKPGSVLVLVKFYTLQFLNHIIFPLAGKNYKRHLAFLLQKRITASF